MALKNQSLTVNFLAWDTSNNQGKTGDSANFTLRLVKDGGTPAAPTNAVSEPDSTNMPGIYEITLTAAEMNADFITLHGVSSTANISIIPVFIHTEGGNLDATVSSRLAPTTGGRTLDVTTGGTAGVNLGNVEGTLTQANVGWVDASSRVDVGSWLGTAVTVSATTSLPEVDSKSISDNTTAANNVEANIANLDVAVSTRSTITQAQVNSEVDTALADIHLDHFIQSADPGTIVADNSLFAKLVSKAATPTFSGYDNTTDSLEALRDRGDAAWPTATGFSTHSAADVWTAATRTLTGFSFTVDANLTQVLGTAVTETTGGNLAGAFSNWYDVGTANNNVNSAPLGTAMRGTDNALLASSAPTNFGDLSIQATSGEVKVIETTAAGNTLLTTGNVNVSAGVVESNVQQLAGNAIQQSGGYVHARDEHGRAILAVMTSGTAQSGTGSDITLAASESSQNQIFRDQRIEIVGGTGAGQGRIITDYNGSTKVATVDEAWVVNPDSTSDYEIMGGKAELARTTHEGATIATVTDVTNAVTVGTVNDGAIGAAAFTDIFDTQTVTLPGQEAPTATPTIQEAIAFLYKRLRNKSDYDGSTEQIYADDETTVHHKRTVSESGGTVTHGELGSGP